LKGEKVMEEVKFVLSEVAEYLAAIQEFYVKADESNTNIKVRYWIGRFRTFLQKEQESLLNSRNDLFTKYGEKLIVPAEKVDMFLNEVFGDERTEEKKEYRKTILQGGIGEEKFSAFKEKYPDLVEKADVFVKKNPLLNMSILKLENTDTAMKEFNDLLKEEVTCKFRPIKISAENEDKILGKLVMWTPKMWEIIEEE
jgi:hypothetical protein